jgi:acyl-ACP thioesterase
VTQAGAPKLDAQTFRVHGALADARGRLRPRVLLEFLQEAAGRDAEARGAGMGRLRELGLGWMLLRLRVDVAAWPAAPEEVTVATWPTAFGRASAERDFEVQGAGGARRVRASSRWAVVDLVARRAVRLPEFIRALPVPTEGSLPFPAFPERDEKARPLGRRTIEVGRSDLDEVEHANNTRYLDWALSALPSGFEDGREIARLDLAFRREVRLGDRLTSEAFLFDTDLVLHELRPEAGGEPCASVVSRWRPRDTGKTA